MSATVSVSLYFLLHSNVYTALPVTLYSPSISPSLESERVMTIRPVLAAVVIAGLLSAGSVLAAPRTDVIIGMSTEPTGLDPTAAAPVAIGQVVWQNLFEGLVSIDEAGRTEPQLAESWEISDDGLTYTFHLREGVRFQTARPLMPKRRSFR